MFNATTASLAQLRAFAADHNIAIDGDRRRKQSYVDSITAWQAECGDFEPAMTEEDFDDLLDRALSINRDELTTEEAGVTVTEVTEQEIPAGETSFAPILLLVCQLVLVLMALPIVLTGGLLRAIAFGIVRLANWLAMPKHGCWGICRLFGADSPNYAAFAPSVNIPGYNPAP